MRAPGTAGCFGKLRCNGDFVTRRLPSSFVEPWDVMLQAGLLASRDALGSAWLDAYLTAPLWSFALGGAVLGSVAWAGVLMPSVDRAGRHFPLTIAAPIAADACADWMPHSGGWFARCRELALSTLMPHASLADFDAGLSALSDASGKGEAPPRMAGTHGVLAWWQEGEVREAAGLPDAVFVAALFDGRAF
ncbi:MULTISPECIES: type VI secretion system-associated protein TagF [unclassified Caballeronia]|uniref:type VI secretion system-associated protein TagF n=1 Tax=unclassified Caballeronia TaxID=2646786 RepID=UPI002029A413|nr:MULTISPECIES: type VI secretion system-associated protein TagF [unclassified Caballeronia]